jgi:hypothetical protein
MNSHPNVMHAVIASSSSSSSSGGGIDFHAIAKSELGRKRKIPEPLPKPTFRFDDLLIVFELKQKKKVIIQGDSENGGEEKISSVVETVGTFWENGSADILDGVDFDLMCVPVIVLEEKNPLCRDTYSGDAKGKRLWARAMEVFTSSLSEAVTGRLRWHTGRCPINQSGMNVYGQLTVSVTLFRRDDWPSFCMLENAEMEDADRSGGSRPDSTFESWTWPIWGSRHQSPQMHNSSSSSPFARNGHGNVAHEILESKEIRKMAASVSSFYNCVLPPSGSSEEPEWLAELRRTEPEWTEELKDDIAQVKAFQFRLESVSLHLAHAYSDYENGDLSDFEDPDAFLLLLEGLDWK